MEIQTGDNIAQRFQRIYRIDKLRGHHGLSVLVEVLVGKIMKKRKKNQATTQSQNSRSPALIHSPSSLAPAASVSRL
jgi:hypothetical protein